jgi:myosin heavy subunit
VWLPDDTDLFLPAKVMSKFEPGKPGVVATVATSNNLGSNRKLSANETKDLLPMDPQSLKMVDDMVTLKQLDKASILHNLRLRFEKDTIYTNIGSILVAVNPFKTLPLYGPEVVDKYLDGSAPGQSLPPHIYAVGEEAFNRMMRYKKSQSCIVSGESGSGKTETTKLFLQYVAEKSSALAAQFGAQSDTNLQEQILQANPLLEAFGNAKTVRNDNSSRLVSLCL